MEGSDPRRVHAQDFLHSPADREVDLATHVLWEIATHLLFGHFGPGGDAWITDVTGVTSMELAELRKVLGVPPRLDE